MIRRPPISLSYVGFYGLSFEDFATSARERGFSSIQLVPDQTPNLVREFDAARLAALHGRLIAAGLACSLHAVFYDINLVSVVPEVQEAALLVLRQNFEFAVALGATRVTVHPGYMFPGWRSSRHQEAAFWAAAETGISRLDALARESGVKAFLENGSYYLSSLRSKVRSPLHIGITIAEMSRLLAGSTEAVGLCLDVGKAGASGLDFRTFLAEFHDRVGQIQVSTWRDYRDLVASREFVDLSAVPEIVFEGGADQADEFVQRLVDAEAGLATDQSEDG